MFLLVHGLIGLSPFGTMLCVIMNGALVCISYSPHTCFHAPEVEVLDFDAPLLSNNLCA